MRVELIDHGGSDLSVVNAARVSFDKFHEFMEGGDVKLINYLAKHNHWTPFAHTFLSFRIKAPIFVARQLGKHQVGLVWNEVSRRYVDSEPEFYFPETWRARAENVKQGSSEEEVPFIRRHNPIHGLGQFTTTPHAIARVAVDACLGVYQDMLASGICPEQARMVLPQNMLTEWVWSGNVASFARVVKLRLDPHTQSETRDVARAIDLAAYGEFPHSWLALTAAN